MKAYEALVEWHWHEKKTPKFWEKCPAWISLVLNWDLCDERPATSCVKRDQALHPVKLRTAVTLPLCWESRRTILCLWREDLMTQLENYRRCFKKNELTLLGRKSKTIHRLPYWACPLSKPRPQLMFYLLSPPAILRPFIRFYLCSASLTLPHRIVPESNAYTDCYVCPFVCFTSTARRVFTTCNTSIIPLEAKHNLKINLLLQRITKWRAKGREVEATLALQRKRGYNGN